MGPGTRREGEPRFLKVCAFLVSSPHVGEMWVWGIPGSLVIFNTVCREEGGKVVIAPFAQRLGLWGSHCILN